MVPFILPVAEIITTNDIIMAPLFPNKIDAVSDATIILPLTPSKPKTV